MPVSRDGESASAASAASRGQLADVGQVGVDAVRRCRCRARSGPPWPSVRSPPMRGEELAQPVARLGGAARPAGHGDRAAGDQRGGQERGRAGEVGLDVPAAARRAGPARPATRRACVVDVGAGGAQHLHGHPQVRRARHGRPPCRSTMPRSKSGAASSSPETNWLERGGVDHDLAAARPGRRRARSAAARRPRQPRCDAEGAQRVDQRRHRALARARVAVEGDRPGGERRPAAAGTASPCRPARRRPGPGRAAAAGGSTHGSSSRWRRRRPGRAGRPPSVRCRGRAAGGRGCRAVRQRGEHQRAGGHRLGSGQADGGADRCGRGRCGPRCRRLGHVAILPSR